MKDFQEIYETACLHKGGASAVEAMLPAYSTEAELRARSDNEYLSLMSLRIFRAGLKHSLVDSKWPEFEQVFKGFDPLYCAHLSDDFIDDCLANKGLIRHYAKLKTIRVNAAYILQKSDVHGGFGAYLAAWPVNNIVELWLDMKKCGAHLGGRSAAVFLRMVGKDTFMLTDDVVAVLKNQEIVSKMPSSQRDIRLVQQAFNQWMSQSGRPLCEISRIISMSAM